MKKSMIMLVAIVLVSACTRHGFPGIKSLMWDSDCPEFPTEEKVNQVIQDKEEFINYLTEEELISFVMVGYCPGGSYLTIVLRRITRAKFFRLLDEHNARTEGVNTFYGVPLRLIRL